jgi:molybdopterin/thiamine biosynthesis adenylyltransferase
VDTGLLRLTSEVQCHGKPLQVTIEFAAEHPFITPTVRGDRVVLDRHQMPSGKNFCLDREDAPWWTPQHTAADLLEHLQALLAADEVGTLETQEADMPEPISRQIHYPRDDIVVVPETLLADTLSAQNGTLELISTQHRPHLWVVHQFKENSTPREVITKDELQRLGLVGGFHRVKASWQAFDLPRGRPGVEQALKELFTTARPAAQQAAGRLGRKVTKRQVWSAITFLEEGPKRGEQQRAWVFAHTTVPLASGTAYNTKPVATQALSRRIRQLRLRELTGLEHVRFLVIGAGSVGGHVAVELARAGSGALDIVDGDHYDLNNGVRHVLPSCEAGRNKAEAVADLAGSCSPFTDTYGHGFTIGTDEQGKRRLLELIRKATVVVDATGSRNITRLLHWRCAHAGVPLVSGALTPGGLGARIVILRALSPCLDCFYMNSTIPVPDSGRDANTTPYGCSHPAASCAPFDVTELAANLVRCATRCIPRLAYPRLDFDWAVINYRRSNGRWTQGLMEAQADCPACGS